MQCNTVIYNSIILKINLNTQYTHIHTNLGFTTLSFAKDIKLVDSFYDPIAPLLSLNFNQSVIILGKYTHVILVYWKIKLEVNLSFLN